ncbi:hypothetical protein [Eggerthella timonensis]|uniref:hypothetical protein n=1 Tax=Eggerthella timonensis TaxID=1871008 RepID=UPI000C784058|nr:hypothetical protein [Eggerthella timonensis]
MVEPERTPVLTLDELLGLSDDGAGRGPDAGGERAEEDPEDVLRQLFGGGRPAEAVETRAPEPEPAPHATPAATLASLFGVEEAPETEPSVADDAPAFDLFAAFGAPAEEQAEASSGARRAPEPPAPEPAASFDLASALGVEPSSDGRVEVGEPAREEPRPVRGRFANLGSRPPKPEPVAASRPQPAAAPKPEPAAASRTEPDARKPEPETVPKPAPVAQAEPKRAAAAKPAPTAASKAASQVPAKHPALAGKPVARTQTEGAARVAEPVPIGKAPREARPAPASRSADAAARGEAERAQEAPSEPRQATGEPMRDASAVRAEFDRKVARKRLPASVVGAAAQPEPASRPEREAGSSQPARAAADESPSASKEPAAPAAPKPASAASTPRPSARGSEPTKAPVPETKAAKPVTLPSRQASQAAGQREGLEAGKDEGRSRKLVFAGVALTAVAALAGALALAVALDGGSAATRGESTPLAALAVGPDQASAGTVEYRYKVKGAGDGEGKAVERATFGDDGFLVRSEIKVEFPDADQALSFLEEARSAFGDALVEGSVEGSAAVFTVDAQGEPVDRPTYTQLLRRDTVDCEMVER